MAVKEHLVFAMILCLAVVFCAMDLLGDYREQTSIWHLLIEGGLLTCSLAGLGYLVWQWRGTRRQLFRANRDLNLVQEDFARFQSEARGYLEGLGRVIDGQFAQWQLTEAERQVGLLMLKGLSFKEIGIVRQTSERTVRQQAQGIYAKAGIAGRIEFAAFFLEDLLLPNR